MASEDLILVVLVSVLAAVTVSALASRWAMKKVRRNLHPDSLTDGTHRDLVLDFPKTAIKYAATPLLVSGAGVSALLVLEILTTEGSLSPFVSVYAFLGAYFLGNSLWMLYGYRDARFFMNAEGVGRTGPGSDAFFVRWRDIRTIRMSYIISNCFVLVTAEGSRRIPVMLNGMADFASMIAVKVPRSARGSGGVERTLLRLVKGSYF
jgi:hypothetical protein